MATFMVRPMGTVVLKTTCATPSTLDTSMYVVKELNIVGSRCGPFPEAIKLLESGSLPVSQYISAVFPLEEAQQAVALAKTKGCLKVQIAIASSELPAVGLRMPES